MVPGSSMYEAADDDLQANSSLFSLVSSIFHIDLLYLIGNSGLSVVL